MVRFGILELLRERDGGMTIGEIAAETKLSDYAVRVLL